LFVTGAKNTPPVAGAVGAGVDFYTFENRFVLFWPKAIFVASNTNMGFAGYPSCGTDFS
jgi:hypothetical protein